MIDSHCHLAYEGIFENLDEKLRVAKFSGVDYFLTVGTDFQTMNKNIEISEKYENVVCSVGIHPHHFNDGYSISEIESKLKNPKVVAIGEVGLDYHYQDETPKADQITLFEEMLSLSKKTDLPYIFHARECFEDIFDIISKYDIKNAVFHCFTDSLENAKKILDRGYYISFSGAITFKKCEELREIAAYVPDDRFLIETDCPYLAPVPYRGKLNEPAYVNLVAECISEVRKCSVEKISKVTDDNFFNLFPKAKFLLEKTI